MATQCGLNDAAENWLSKVTPVGGLIGTVPGVGDAS